VFQGNLSLPEPEKEKFNNFFIDHHAVFILEANKHGETNLVQLVIDTGYAQSKKKNHLWLNRKCPDNYRPYRRTYQKPKARFNS